MPIKDGDTYQVDRGIIGLIAIGRYQERGRLPECATWKLRSLACEVLAIKRSRDDFN